MKPYPDLFDVEIGALKKGECPDAEAMSFWRVRGRDVPEFQMRPVRRLLQYRPSGLVRGAHQ